MIATVSAPRVLIINCYADRHGESRGSPAFIPQSIAPIALAGILNPDKCEVRTYSEFHSGPFADFDLLEWANLLVLTGLNTAFDRMRHLTAYAKTRNPSIPVVMGGSIARVLPRLCSRYFDYVCDGDVEQLSEIVDECFGPGYTVDDPIPRQDLMDSSPLNVGYVESTRNCNFRCSFCSMSAENRPFKTLGTDFLRRQLDTLGYRRAVIFMDQNFYGGPRDFFRARIELIQDYYDRGRFGGWGCLLTEDFFKKTENIEAARRSGCIGFYSGVESFDSQQIAAFNKRQNLILPQEQVIRSCLEAGMVFNYGLVFDPLDRTVESLEEELDFIVSNPRITLPSFISFAIPMLGTPLFHQRLATGQLLPNMKLLDMDGRGLCTRSLSDEAQVVALAQKIDRQPLPKHRLLRHAAGFYRTYRKQMGRWALFSSLMNTISMGAPGLGANSRDGAVPARARRRTYHASTESLGSLYVPAMRLQPQFEEYFAPLYVTNAEGELHEALGADLYYPATQSSELTLA